MNASAVTTADVLVSGAGLHGTSSAFNMARRGVSVIVRQLQLAPEATAPLNAGARRARELACGAPKAL